MSIALDRFVPVKIAGFTLTLMIGVAVGAMGWWIGVTEPALRRFNRWLIPFIGLACVSIIASGRGVAQFKEAGGILVFFLLIPGFASMAQDPKRFRALLTGLVIGASFLLTVVVFRVAGGRSALDHNGMVLQLLGLNRNAIDITIVWLVPPVLLSKTLGLPRTLRLMFLAGSILWIVNSQGRTGLFALLLVPALMVLLIPSKEAVGQVSRVLAVLGFAALLVFGLGNVHVSWLPATERIDQFQSGDRASADDIRSLLGKKALNLTEKHPLLGVGFGNFEGQYDPVVETARSEHIREEALALPAHNTYYEIAATTGVPGVLLFVGALLTPIVAGWRYRYDDDVRSLLAGYGIVLFCITFHTSYGSVICLPVALTLAAIARAASREEADDDLAVA